MEFNARTESDLTNICQEFLHLFNNHTVFAFKGEMGVGKTTFISYLAKAMDIVERVSSPTFGYVNEYQSETFGTVYHFDLYRIESEEEAYDIGIEEYIYGNDIVLIEWAEKMENILPESCVWVNLTKEKNGSRKIEITL